MLRVERGTELFPFLAVLGGVFDALYAGHTFTLHGIRRYVSKPQKVTRSRASATRYCNHGMMQSIRANGRTFTNQASIVFSRPISRQLCPRISGNPVRLESVHNFICKTVLAKTAGVKSILMTGGRKCLPPFLTDGMNLCLI